MSLKQFLLNFAFISLLVGMNSCSDDEATVQDISGIYTLTAFETKNCDDSGDNFKLSQSSDGLCFTDVDGSKLCIEVKMTFSNGSYTIVFTTKSGGFTFSSNDSGTYDPNSQDVELCIDGVCDNLEITNNGDKIKFSYKDPDDGCDYFLELERS